MSIWLQESSVPRADEKRKPALRHVRLRKSVFSCHRRAKTLHGLIWGSSALFRKKCLNSRGILAVFSPNHTYLLKIPIASLCHGHEGDFRGPLILRSQTVLNLNLTNSKGSRKLHPLLLNVLRAKSELLNTCRFHITAP